MKVIIINTPDGEYTLPLKLVAEHRANEYSDTLHSLQWADEVQYTMGDDFEGIDWLLNSTDYEEWEDDTTKISNIVKVTLEDFWTNSEDFKIVEI